VRVLRVLLFFPAVERLVVVARFLAVAFLIAIFFLLNTVDGSFTLTFLITMSIYPMAFRAQQGNIK